MDTAESLLRFGTAAFAAEVIASRITIGAGEPPPPMHPSWGVDTVPEGVSIRVEFAAWFDVVPPAYRQEAREVALDFFRAGVQQGDTPLVVATGLSIALAANMQPANEDPVGVPIAPIAGSFTSGRPVAMRSDPPVDYRALRLPAEPEPDPAIARLRARIGDNFEIESYYNALQSTTAYTITCTECGWLTTIHQGDDATLDNGDVAFEQIVYAWEMHEIERELRGEPYGEALALADGTFAPPSGIAVRKIITTTTRGARGIDHPAGDFHIALFQTFGDDASVIWDRDCGEIIVEHALVDTHARSVVVGDEEVWWVGSRWERSASTVESMPVAVVDGMAYLVEVARGDVVTPAEATRRKILAPIVCPASDRRRPGLRAAWIALGERAKRCGVELFDGPSAEPFEYEWLRLPGPDGGSMGILSREFETPWTYIERVHRLVDEFDTEMPEAHRATCRKWRLGTGSGY